MSLDLLLAIGRGGDDPGALSGIAIILGVVVAVAILGFAGHLLVHRFGRTRHDSKRRPHRPGRVGRVSEFRRD
jgi:hypothetical protein